MRQPAKKQIKMKTNVKPKATGPGHTRAKPKAKTSKSNVQKLDSFAKNVYKYAGPENFLVAGKALKVGKSLAKKIKK